MVSGRRRPHASYAPAGESVVQNKKKNNTSELVDKSRHALHSCLTCCHTQVSPNWHVWVQFSGGTALCACVCGGGGGGGGDLQQNRASDSSSCERMRSACLHFV